MQLLFHHITTFARLMERKGYDGYHQSSCYGYADKLKDTLTQHVLQCLQEKKEIQPLMLTTYSKWRDDKSPYVECNFFVNHSGIGGFKVRGMNIQYANQYGKIREKNIPIKDNRDIPDRDQANRMVIGRKQGMKL